MTGRDGSGAWHTVWCAAKALAATLATLLVALIDQLRFTGGIDAPEAALARFVLGASDFYKVPAAGGKEVREEERH